MEPEEIEPGEMELKEDDIDLDEEEMAFVEQLE